MINFLAEIFVPSIAEAFKIPNIKLVTFPVVRSDRDAPPTGIPFITENKWLNGLQWNAAIVAAYRWDERWGRFFELLAQDKPDEAIDSLESFAEDELLAEDWFTVYTLTGAEQETLALLEEFYRERDVSLPQMVTDRILGTLYDAPRVVELRRELGL